MVSTPKRYLYTSEQVSGGHPDKLCDYVSDSVLDACLEIDPNARVACETAVKNNNIMVFGEISMQGEISIESVVRKAAKEIGYDDYSKGFDYKNCQVIVNIDRQSPEITTAVGEIGKEDIGAGDQGIMFGYATDEHESFMPISYVFATDLLKKLRECMDDGTLPWVRPDAKSQVTVEYEESDMGLKPIKVHTVLLSTQHSPNVTQEEIQRSIQEHIIAKVIPSALLHADTKYFINPSGSFIVGGPNGDAGLTGRKIIADTYGGWGSHGGGCFSGKDGSKVDRSGAYAARWIAKSLVAAGMVHRCLVQLSYGIGVPHPLSVFVNSYGTGATKGFSDEVLADVITRNFELRAGMLVSTLSMKTPFFRQTTLYGHFLKSAEVLPWESPKDLSHELKKN